MTELIYLDYNSTTPVDPSVLDCMLPWFDERFWNASSAHVAGRRAADAVEGARQWLADLLGVRARELVFTSGATEAINTALRGAAEAAEGRNRVLVAATEHKAVLDTASWLAEQGHEVTIVPVMSDGSVDVDVCRELIDEQVAVLAVMLANNETGVVASIAQLAEVAHENGALFFTDATQAVGRISVDLADLGVDLAAFSAHKVYGPKGVGGLYVRRGVTIVPLIHGGGHERGWRSGTLNVPGIVGLGAAAQLATKLLSDESRRQAELVARLVDTLRARLTGVEWIAEAPARLPNTAMIRFVGADAEAVMVNADDVAISSGSACTSRTPAPSHVLVAMGLSRDAALETLRFSVGRPTTVDEIDVAAMRVATAVERVRSLRTAGGRDGEDER